MKPPALICAAQSICTCCSASSSSTGVSNDMEFTTASFTVSAAATLPGKTFGATSAKAS